MSAIYGIINKDGKPVDPEMVQKMKQAMKHRAKDGGAEWTGDNSAFGFCHLIVYPNQENEKLPVESGDLVITANAHLHNREELVKKLGVDKKRYATTPDSYLILKAFEKWGGDCVHHLDGEYVYAIWNKESKELFISNDHIGYKSLYYYDTAERFVFCSEIKGIEAVKTTINFLDYDSMAESLFKYGQFPEATYNQQIKRLTGAKILRLGRQNLEINQYWRLTTAGKYNFCSEDQWYSCLRQLFINSIESRVNRNVPVGISLSGGLDSSSIACVLARMLERYNMPLYSFSSVSVSPDNKHWQSDKLYIDAITSSFSNIVPTYVSAPESGPFTNIPHAFFLDETVPNGFHYMDVAILNAAEPFGIKNFYAGFGGDFWISAKGKYDIYRLIIDLKLRKASKIIAEIAKAEKRSKWHVIKTEFIIYTSVLNLYYQLINKNFSKQVINKKISNKIRAVPRDSVLQTLNYINNGSAGMIMSMLDNRNEFYGMASANPFFDKNLMEFMSDVPREMLIKNGYRRNLLRGAMEGILPKEVQYRTSKSSYVLDYPERIFKSRYTISDVLQSDKLKPIIETFFRKGKLEKLYEISIGRNKMDNPFKAEGLMLSMFIISVLAVENIKERGYFI
jgi:asparagine synthase (glutamine-hydrolysing)